ncbi:uncharacterized protein LOC130981746 [Arachis stenosperma]|uniref:uncharacterized protein LOC130981746 n=1 Tax=Arachis stenosperma TaxID=217475 RepID=UPI0025ACD9F0|nr:uncharacterized protein LOC130981746 [Arachis stenosperma]
MYVTRHLSHYKKDPNALSGSLPDPEGPNSGYLVLQDEAAQSYCCFGLWKNNCISHLPFPQDKNLTVTYIEGHGEDVTIDLDKVIFIPVLNQSLSSNRYYVIRRKGKHQGEACTSSKQEDMKNCLFCKCVKDVKPRPLDPFNEYQQFEIIKTRCGFYAKPVAEDAFPPLFLRRKSWRLCAKTPHNYTLDEALGINHSLRGQLLPTINFPLSNDRSDSVVIGKWYCPFMFVKEGMKLKDQMKGSVFYEMTLEQRWEKIFSKKNSSIGSEGRNEVFVDVVVETELAMVDGKQAFWDEGNVDDGVLWFKSLDNVGGGVSVGLSLVIVERMKWEQERGGWLGFNNNNKQVRVTREEKFEGAQRWEDFGCFVLVESFVLKRMDGSVVVTYDFRHTHQIMCKWE